MAFKPSQPKPTNGLTTEEDLQLVELLEKWKGGGLSDAVFTKLAGIIPQSIVEVVFLRKHKGSIETLLIPRPEDDIVFPGMLHTPGTVLRRSDFLRPDSTPINGAFERIQQEVQNEFLFPPTYAGQIHRLIPRGPEVASVYFSSLLNETNQPGHLWLSIEKLLDNPKFLQFQLTHILMSAEVYSKST